MRTQQVLSLVRRAIELLAFKAGLVAVGFVVVAAITRYFGAESAGRYFWLLAFASLVVVFLRFGRDTGLIKKLAGTETLEERNQIIMKAIGWVLLSSVVYIAGAGLVLFTLGEFVVLDFTLACIFLPPLMAIGSLLGFILQVEKKTSWQQFYLDVPRLAAGGSAVGVGLWLSDTSLYYSVLLFSLLATLVSALHIKRLGYLRGKININVLGEARYYSQFLLISVTALLMVEGAVIFTGFFGTSEQVAELAVSSRIVRVIILILLAFNAVYTPEFAKLHKQGKQQQLVNAFQSARNKSSALALFGGVGLAIVGKPLLSLFGEAFTDSYYTFVVLLAAQVIKVMVGSTGQLLMMTGYQAIQQRTLMISIVIMLVLSWALIPSLGSLGASISLLIAVIIQNVFGLTYCVKHHGVPWLPFVKITGEIKGA
ncbi:MATE family efflux transporter [Pseudoalteromonas xiamenensis]